MPRRSSDSENSGDYTFDILFESNYLTIVLSLPPVKIFLPPDYIFWFRHYITISYIFLIFDGFSNWYNLSILMYDIVYFGHKPHG